MGYIDLELSKMNCDKSVTAEDILKDNPSLQGLYDRMNDGKNGQSYIKSEMLAQIEINKLILTNGKLKLLYDKINQDKYGR